ncbi:MAG: c-type cytochrome [Pseudomonadota bacterium]
MSSMNSIETAAIAVRAACVSVFLAFFSGPASAADGDPTGFGNGDPEAGLQKSTICAACHGQDGNSLNPLWPSLAGQHTKYIIQQLQYFKGGDRNNVLMSAQAAGLSEQDMQDLAAYYGSQTKTIREVANTDNIDVGRRLYRGGDPERGLPACIACHGPDGSGNPGVPYPAIGGQHSSYIASSLREYAADDDKRSNTETQNQMTTIALKLEPNEIDALASYLQGLN